MIVKTAKWCCATFQRGYNSDTSRHAAAQRIMFSPGHEPTPTKSPSCRQVCQHICAMCFLDRCSHGHVYIRMHTCSRRTHSTHDRPMVVRLIGVGRFLERRARARGHRMLYSLYSNTPDTSYNNLVFKPYHKHLYKAISYCSITLMLSCASII